MNTYNEKGSFRYAFLIESAQIKILKLTHHFCLEDAASQTAIMTEQFINWQKQNQNPDSIASLESLSKINTLKDNHDKLLLKHTKEKADLKKRYLSDFKLEKITFDN